MVYADNAATTQMSIKAAEDMIKCMREVWGNASSLYGFGQNYYRYEQKGKFHIYTYGSVNQLPICQWIKVEGKEFQEALIEAGLYDPKAKHDKWSILPPQMDEMDYHDVLNFKTYYSL